MSEFLGFAWELLAKVVYNVVAVVSSILNLLVFGWVEYFNIFMTYFTTFDLVGKIGAVILFAMLIAVPVLIVAILVHRYRINRRLHRDDTSNKALYREIGRLNKQVLDLMDEKNKLLALKVNAMGGTKQIPYVGASALADDHLPTVGNVVGAAAGAGAPAGEGATAAVVSGNASLALDGDGVKDAAAAMAKATVEAKTLAEERKSPRPTASPSCPLWTLVPRLGIAGLRRCHLAGGLCRQLPRVRLQPDEALLHARGHPPLCGRHGRLQAADSGGHFGYR